MSRFAVGVVFGLVVGVVGGAALSIHAATEGGVGADEAPLGAQAEEVVTAPAPTPEPAYGIWDRLAACESGGNWASRSNPKYKGGLQMDSTFWARYGGLAYAARADYASRAQQILVAQRGQAVQGWGAWPVCSRVVGLQ